MEINYSPLYGPSSMTFATTGCWSFWKDVNYCMNKLNVPSVSREVSNIVIIPGHDDETILRQPSLLSHCLLNTEQLSHGIFLSSVCEHATHISERVTTIVRFHNFQLWISRDSLSCYFCVSPSTSNTFLIPSGLHPLKKTYFRHIFSHNMQQYLLWLCKVWRFKSSEILRHVSYLKVSDVSK